MVQWSGYFVSTRIIISEFCPSHSWIAPGKLQTSSCTVGIVTRALDYGGEVYGVQNCVCVCMCVYPRIKGLLWCGAGQSLSCSIPFQKKRKKVWQHFWFNDLANLKAITTSITLKSIPSETNRHNWIYTVHDVWQDLGVPTDNISHWRYICNYQYNNIF